MTKLRFLLASIVIGVLVVAGVHAKDSYDAGRRLQLHDDERVVTLQILAQTADGSNATIKIDGQIGNRDPIKVSSMRIPTNKPGVDMLNNWERSAIVKAGESVYAVIEALSKGMSWLECRVLTGRTDITQRRAMNPPGVHATCSAVVN